MNRQIINRRYRVERRIGEGGTAEVYLGFDIVLNRRIAIKTLRPQFASNRAFRLRFEREAQAVARFSHPNIIAIFDVGEDSGLPYIVMEYVEGQSLKEIIEAEGPFHPDDVAILVEQVAAGLDYAHQRGLVHRDVKPQNILVDRHGLAKVVDFGIAKGLSDSTLTETGAGLGTVHYISPEQASGLMATPESDIYSLGVIAYEMLTGQLPFESESAVGIAMRHLNDPPPDPAELNPNVPPEAADVVLQALHKNPTRRYPTAGAFARTLSDWRLYQPQTRLAARVARSRPLTVHRSPTRVFDPAAPARPNDPTALIPPIDRQPPVALDEGLADRSGGKSWIAGLIAVVAIAAILWYGLDLSDRLGGGRGGAEPTKTAVAIVPTHEPAKTPTPPPTAVATKAPQLASVPNVVGISPADAENQIAADGFVAVAGESVASDTVPAGMVAQQSPPAGDSAGAGSRVTYQVSSGPVAVDLAALNAAGRPSKQVIDELTSVGINVSVVNEGNAQIPEGSVIRLEPADSAKPGDTVSVVISMGNKVQIPVDLQGQPLATARTRLQSLGFTIAGEIGVDAATITNAGLDIKAAGIQDGDVVGIQDNNASFGAWIDPGVSVTLVYYEAALDQSNSGSSG